MRLWTKPTLPEFAVLVTANLILWDGLATGQWRGVYALVLFLSMGMLPDAIFWMLP